MDIYFRWCNRKTECNYCHESIRVDTIVAVHTWRNRKKWSGRIFYHPECFPKQFVYKVKMEIPRPIRANRGRPSLGLNTKEKKERATMLRANKRKENRENNSSRGA